MFTPTTSSLSKQQPLEATPGDHSPPQEITLAAVSSLSLEGRAAWTKLSVVFLEFANLFLFFVFSFGVMVMCVFSDFHSVGVCFQTDVLFIER